ncbi:MAG: phenylacetate--CoA ligase family protein [Syntrophaceae bacterium]|nr:phenylacetate--CoA ligase family protein [Syntrophaceae bacterium]
MDWYAFLCRHMVTPIWAKKERSPYLDHCRRLDRFPGRSMEDLRAIQWEKLRELIQHAWEKVEYYREKWRSIGFRPEDLKSKEDLLRLPLLTKEDIRAHKPRMIAHGIPTEKLIPKKTSGSTGVSLEFFVDDDSIQWKRGCELHFNQWTGWKIGEKVAAIWGNPTHRANWRAVIRNALLERYDYLNTLKMSEEQMLAFYQRQLRRKPKLLFGHAHSIYLFANFLRQKKLEPFRPKGILSTCMVLHDFERRRIEETFGCRVFNRYGCEEVSLISCECEAHQGLHLNLNTLAVEFLRDGRPAKPGEPGALVVTDLTNYGMPFIRYKVGDVGIPSGKECPCGRPLPLMESLEGRVADYVVTPEGNLISGISLTENFAMELPEIKQVQIVQEKPDVLVFRVVRSETFSAGSEEKIRNLALQRFGKTMRFECEYVEHIPQEANGKYRFCISKVKNPFA